MLLGLIFKHPCIGTAYSKGSTPSAIIPFVQHAAVESEATEWAAVNEARSGTHFIATAGDGQLFMWGLNQHGQCALGSLTESSGVRLKAADVLQHTQLGTSNWIANVYRPLRVEVDSKIAEVHCGWSHTIAVTGNHCMIQYVCMYVCSYHMCPMHHECSHSVVRRVWLGFVHLCQWTLYVAIYNYVERQVFMNGAIVPRTLVDHRNCMQDSVNGIVMLHCPSFLWYVRKWTEQCLLGDGATMASSVERQHQQVSRKNVPVWVDLPVSRPGSQWRCRHWEEWSKWVIWQSRHVTMEGPVADFLCTELQAFFVLRWVLGLMAAGGLHD